VFGIFSFISLNRHSVAKPFSYHSELWADKAGYNVYLPASLIYDFDARKFPALIEVKTGHGFQADSLSGKIITKYPYGVSLFQSPFWLLAHAISSGKDGYSFLYQKSINIAGSFYLSVGLFFLFFTIRKFKSGIDTFILSLGIVLSTGIFYYGIFDTGMSHIYSFVCLTAIVYLALGITEINYRKPLVWIAALAVLYTIIRPINIVFLLPALLYFYFSCNTEVRSYVRSPRFILIAALLTFIGVLPQLMYYHYAFGSYITNSYQNEPFIFPSWERIITLLMGSDNGLLLYYPILIVILFFLIKKRDLLSKFGLGLFLIYLIIYASWWSLSLGCGFGHRAINDIAPFLFIPLFMGKEKTSRLILGSLIVCSLINIKFMFSYDTCLFSSEPFNYSEYRSILFGEFK
jgi:hypothetical protein